MKLLLIVLSIISLVSCQNKKAHLVDLDRSYRDSARKYYDLAGMRLEDSIKSHPHKTELERYRTHDTSDVISKEAMDQYKYLLRQGSNYKVMADSIEWELKKY